MIKGVVRNIDALGRITLPKEYRKAINLNEGDPVDMYFDNGVICVKPARLQCVLCGSEDERGLMEVDSVLICNGCVANVVDKYMDGLL